MQYPALYGMLQQQLVSLCCFPALSLAPAPAAVLVMQESCCKPQCRNEHDMRSQHIFCDFLGVGGLTSFAFFPRRGCERSRSYPVTCRCSSLPMETPSVGADLALNVDVYMSCCRTAKKYLTYFHIS